MVRLNKISLYQIYHSFRKVYLSLRFLKAFSKELTNLTNTFESCYAFSENTYPQRSEKYIEVAFDGVKIDFYDPKNRVVHEVKKSDRLAEAYRAQVKYYLWILEKNGIEGASFNMIKNLKYYDKRGRDLEPIIEQIETYRTSLPLSKEVPDRWQLSPSLLCRFRPHYQ